MALVNLNIDGGYAWIEISREKALNALNNEVLKELKEHIREVSESEARVLFLIGSGDKAFVAGADISEMKNMSAAEAQEFSRLGQDVFSSLEQLDQVVIGLVNGFALGGGFELVLACDVVLASSKSKFGLPEVGLGLIPGFGGTQRLSRSLGMHYAKTLTLSGEMVSADELREKGMIFSCHENKEDLIEAGKKFAAKVVSKGPHAVGVAKAAIQEGHTMELPRALEFERSQFGKLFGTDEVNEGVSAFLEKRPPKF